MDQKLLDVFLFCTSVLLLCLANPMASVAQFQYRSEFLRPTRCDGRPATDKSCPALETTLGSIDNVCTYVSFGTKDPNPMWPRYKFKYQRVILEASRVEPTDTPEIIQRKVSTMWPLFQDYISCTWEIQLGSFLKYGLTSSSYSDNFILDITRNWKVPLNDIDPSDGKTLMDFIREKIVLNKDTALGPILEGYYVRLREAGGKHKSELK